MSDDSIMSTRNIIIHKSGTDEVMNLTINEPLRVMVVRKMLKGEVIGGPITYTFEEFEKIVGL